MLKQAVLKQQHDVQRLLSLPYVERDQMVEAIKWLDTDLIKVILGPRRAGKSVLALMLLKDRPFAYVNFDDESMIGQEEFDYDALMSALHGVYGETKTILFDEIQNLPKWEVFVNRLHRQGYNIILTGSNARLLSSELATALTGRHIPLEILPFSLSEFLRAKQFSVSADELALPERRGELLRLLEQFIVHGGYPEVVIKDMDAMGYLTVLFDSVLFTDVVKRHNVRFVAQIDSLATYLVNNVAQEYSMRTLARVLGFKSGVTLEKYLQYLTEAYIVFAVSRYSPKAGERLTAPKKIYCVDNGLVSTKAVRHSSDHGKMLENIVLTELVKQGIVPNRDLFYYKTRNGREIDFVIKKNTEVTELIQVAYQFGSPDTEKREVKALVEAGEELHADKLTILTWDQEKQLNNNGRNIHVESFWRRFCQSTIVVKKEERIPFQKYIKKRWGTLSAEDRKTINR